MQKIFSIYVNSTQKLSGNNNNAVYFMDWPAILPDGRYTWYILYLRNQEPTQM